MFDLDLQTILLILIAITLIGKPILPVLKLLPIPQALKEMLEKMVGNGKNGHDTPQWAKELKEHYNDETTEKLTTIVTTLEAIKDENVKHHAFEEGKFELLEALIKK